MAEGGGLAITPKGVIYDGNITGIGPVNSVYIAGLAGFDDTFFQGWIIFTIKKANLTTTAPYHTHAEITQYISSTGQFFYIPPAGTPSVGDEVYILHRSIALSLTSGTGTSGFGTAVHVNNLISQTVFTDALLGSAYGGRWNFSLFLQNITQRIIIQEYEPDALGVARLIAAREYPTRFDAGVVSVNLNWTTKVDYNPVAAWYHMINLQSVVLEGAARDVPYYYKYESIPEEI
jgi:hypothetical protein